MKRLFGLKSWVLVFAIAASGLALLALADRERHRAEPAAVERTSSDLRPAHESETESTSPSVDDERVPFSSEGRRAAAGSVPLEEAMADPEATGSVRVTVRPILPSGDETEPLRLLAALNGPFGLRREQSVDLPHVEDHVFAFPTTGTIVFKGVHPLAVGTQKLVVSRPGDYEVDLVMDPATRLRGIVVDARTGRPLEGAEVGTYDRDAVGLPPVTTDAAGEFEVAPWPLDENTGLKVRREGYGAELVRLQVENDGSWTVPARFGHPAASGSADAYVDVHLMPEKVVQGVVVAPPAELEDVTIVARGLYLVNAISMMTDEHSGSPDSSGRFRLEGLRSDIRHGVVFRDPEGGLAMHTVPAVPGSFDLGEVVLSEPIEVTGIVLGPGSRPIAGAKVRLDWYTAPEDELDEIDVDPDGGANLERDAYDWHLNLGKWETYTDREGRFTFEGVGRGRCRISVRVMGRTKARRVFDVRGDVQLDPLELTKEIPEVPVDVSGTPAPATATVEIAEAGRTEPLALFRPGADGFFRAQGLRTDQPYVARLVTGEGEAFETYFSLADGQERLSLRFAANPAGSR